MHNKAALTPSTSFVLSKMPCGFTEDDVKDFLKKFLPLEVIKFHQITPTLFLNKATIVFPSIEVANAAAAKYLGKHNGEHNLSFFYSMLPYNLDPNNVVGEVALRPQIDDEGAIQCFMPGTLVKDWNKLTEMPPVPRVTKIISLRYNLITGLTIGGLRVTILNLKGNELNHIDPTVQFPAVKICNLSHNHLTSLVDLVNFIPVCGDLDVSYNELTEIHHSIANLASLEKVDISHNKIKKLPKLPERVNTLQAQCNLLYDADDCHLPNLRNFSFHTNNFTKCPPHGYGRIDQMVFMRNKLTQIDVAAIFSSTIYLNLCSNEIESVPPELFKIKTLKKLVLFDNKIKEIPPEIKMSYLEILDISENPIESVPTLPMTITTFKCSFCQIKDLSGTIPDPNCLSILHASHNQLTFLPMLPEITELIVAHNQLMTLPFINASVFVEVTIDASHNQIRAIPPLASPFRMLDLSYNRLTMIPESLFQYKSTVRLTGNPITQRLDSSLLSQLEKLDIFRTGITIDGDIPCSMKELITDYHGEAATSKSRLYFSGGDSVGYAEMIGLRPTMEDSIVIRENFQPGTHFFAVFDGHGGDEVARFAAAGFPDLLKDYEGPSSIDSVCKEFQSTLLSANETAGATMELVFLKRDSVVISQLGDAKTALFRADGSVRYATEEMRPERRSEFVRLREANVRMARLRCGGTLGMSASLGDFQVKGVCHTPETVELPLEAEDRWLVIACDGLWDDVRLSDVGALLPHCDSPNDAAVLLRNMAFSRGSEDNISVIVVDIKNIKYE